LTKLAHKYKAIDIERPLFFYLAAVILVIGLAVFQDYLFSRIRSTGFYISESLLYNTIWLFFLPLMYAVLRLHEMWSDSSMTRQGLYAFGAAAIFSLIHILLSTSFFVSISYLIFTPGHRFVSIWKSTMSQELYIIFACYAIVPFVHRLISNPKTEESSQLKQYSSTLLLKKTDKIISVDTDKVALIITDKPYTTIFTTDGDKYLDSRSLKFFEGVLDPHLFCRVHRSTIVRTGSVVQIKSRQNGDYDAILDDGRIVRLSRHYRKYWDQLLH